MKKRLPAIVTGFCIFCLCSCGGSGGPPDSSEEEPLKEESQQEVVPPPSNETISVAKAVTVGTLTTSFGIQQMIEIAKQIARSIAWKAKLLFFKEGGMFPHPAGGTQTMGPVSTRALTGSDFFATIDFRSFSTCPTTERHHFPPTSISPLSITFFLGRSSTSLARVASGCFTSNHPVKGTVWIDLQAFFELFTSLPTPFSAFRMKLTLNEIVNPASDANCPYLVCKKFGIQLFSKGIFSLFGFFPDKWVGVFYLIPNDWRQNKLVARMDFANRESGILVQMQNSEKNVVTRFQMFFEDAQATDSILAFVARGMCAIASGSLLTGSQCTFDDSANSVSTNLSVTNLESDTALPALAPPSFVRLQ